MPTPTIKFNILLGSDTEASGAGPETAQFGTIARNRVSTGGTRVGFFDATSPDFSGVDTTGLHCLKIEQATGRRWSKITAVKDTDQVSQGNMTSGLPQVTSMPSTTGMATDDVVRVIGAGSGGVDLYSEILTVDSGAQITLKDNAGTTVTSAAVKDPRQVTIEDSLIVNTSVAWAVGGYLLDIDNSAQLWSDVKPGWIIDFAYVEDKFYTTTAVRNLAGAGDFTSGRITIRGSGGGKPLIKGNATNDIFKLSSALQSISGLAFSNCLAGIVLETSNATDIVISDCDFNTTGEVMTYGISIISSVTGRLHFHTLSIRDCSDAAILCAGSPTILLIENSHLSHVTSTAHTGIEITGSPNLMVRSCCFFNFAEHIEFKTAATPRWALIENNVFEEGAIGINVETNIAVLRNGIIRNNIFYDMNPDIQTLAGSDIAVSMADYNAYRSDRDLTNISAGANDVIADPEFRGRITNETGRDWRVGIAMKGKGWPQTFPFGGLPQAIDIGALQRREPISGNLRIKITGVEDTGDHWRVSFAILISATNYGGGSFVLVPKAQIPTASEIHLPAIVEGFLAYLRAGTPAAAVGEEMLC
jgi:hypothetical protein